MFADSLIEEMSEEILDELGVNGHMDVVQVKAKVKSATREIINRRDYPSHFTDSDKLKDLQKLYANIKNLALYDYNQIGAEGETAHSENEVNRTWKDREDCMKGVFAWAGF